VWRGPAAARWSRRALLLLATAALGGVDASKLVAGSVVAEPAPSKHVVNFDGLPEGSPITQVVGATFGAPAAIGFPETPAAYVCPAAPTARGGAAVAPACAGRDPGSNASGLLVRLNFAAQSVSAQVGTTQTTPGGFAAEIDAFDAAGKRLGTDAALVGSATSGQGTGAVAPVSITVGSTQSIAYVALFFNSFFPPGPQLVLDNLVYSGGTPPSSTTTTTTGGSSSVPPATGAPSGDVRVNGRPFTGGQIRYGSTVDVTHGMLQLATDAGTLRVNGAGGITAAFVLLHHVVGKTPLVELRLAKGDFSQCPKRKKSSASIASATTVRQVWGDGKGRFETSGRYASATVRGTNWLTADRCDGTLTKVVRGVVEVNDIPKRIRIRVPAGRSYLAKP
jgi:hypothetical protein